MSAKRFLTDRYNEIARTVRPPYTSLGRQLSPIDASRRVGYSEEALTTAPHDSIMGLSCGTPTTIASLNKDATVLDLGSGGGIDSFLASRRVGPGGTVVGVDLSDSMVKRANRTAQEHGYHNVMFLVGDVAHLPLKDAFAHVVISNNVVNLCPHKIRVFREARRVLKTGGKLCISDLVRTDDLPEESRSVFNVWSECIEERSQYLATVKRIFHKGLDLCHEGIFDVDVPEKLKKKIMSVQYQAYK